MQASSPNITLDGIFDRRTICRLRIEPEIELGSVIYVAGYMQSPTHNTSRLIFLSRSGRIRSAIARFVIGPISKNVMPPGLALMVSIMKSTAFSSVRVARRSDKTACSGAEH